MNYAKPEIANLTLIAANVEYEVPVGLTSTIDVKARGGIVQISFVRGQSAYDYFKLADGQAWSWDGHGDRKMGPDVRLYFRAPVAGTQLELLMT